MADKQRWADRSADRRQGKGKWHRGGTVKWVKQEVETGGDVFMYCTYVLMACSLFHFVCFHCLLSEFLCNAPQMRAKRKTNNTPSMPTDPQLINNSKVYAQCYKMPVNKRFVFLSRPI